MLKKIDKSSVPQQVFDILRKEIINGTYPVGSKLPSENELVEALGVSRPSVKTALQQLCFLGMAETKAGNGTYVKEFNISDYINQVTDFILDEQNKEEITEYRLQMELTYATAAMEHATEEDLKKMDKILDLMDISYQKRDIVRHSKLDFQLHYLICQATHNQYFSLVFQMFSDIVYQYVLSRNENFFNDMILTGIKPDVHRDIVNAIKKKDKEACRKIYEYKYPVHADH
jgi:GntR family transcriptional repressor for pyruvate dehydrogenase complex